VQLVDEAQGRVVLPAILDSNFALADDLRHAVWIESRRPLEAPGLATGRAEAGTFRLAGALDARALAAKRMAVRVARDPGAVRRVARLGDGEPVVQHLLAQAPPDGSLMLVVDGSARLARSRAAIIKALDAIPDGMVVGAILAMDEPRRVALAPWSASQRQAIEALLREAGFRGGQDNTPALTDALHALEREPNATLLWIHGPQPVAFAATAGRLEQAATRQVRPPALLLYAVEPGPNELLPDTVWAWSARTLPRTGAVEADLAGYFAARAKPRWTARREPAGAQEPAEGSAHIARLWASDRVLELMRASELNRAPAVALATQYRLVTPVSGAVVLETQRQYDQNGLQPVSQASVPTVPEPHEWALIFIAGAFLLRLIWQNRQRLVAA
jgi:hypothetical protein